MSRLLSSALKRLFDKIDTLVEEVVDLKPSCILLCQQVLSLNSEMTDGTIVPTLIELSLLREHAVQLWNATAGLSTESHGAWRASLRHCSAVLFTSWGNLLASQTFSIEALQVCCAAAKELILDRQFSQAENLLNKAQSYLARCNSHTATEDFSNSCQRQNSSKRYLFTLYVKLHSMKQNFQSLIDHFHHLPLSAQSYNVEDAAYDVLKACDGAANCDSHTTRLIIQLLEMFVNALPASIGFAQDLKAALYVELGNAYLRVSDPQNAAQCASKAAQCSRHAMVSFLSLQSSLACGNMEGAASHLLIIVKQKEGVVDALIAACEYYANQVPDDVVTLSIAFDTLLTSHDEEFVEVQNHYLNTLISMFEANPAAVSEKICVLMAKASHHVKGGGQRAKNFRSCYSLGHFLFAQSSNSKEAVTILRAAFLFADDVDSGDQEALLRLLARTHLRESNLADAKAAAMDCYKLNHRSLHTLVILFEVSLLENGDNCQDIVEKMCEADPKEFRDDALILAVEMAQERSKPMSCYHALRGLLMLLDTTLPLHATVLKRLIILLSKTEEINQWFASELLMYAGRVIVTNSEENTWFVAHIFPLAAKVLQHNFFEEGCKICSMLLLMFKKIGDEVDVSDLEKVAMSYFYAFNQLYICQSLAQCANMEKELQACRCFIDHVSKHISLPSASLQRLMILAELISQMHSGGDPCLEKLSSDVLQVGDLQLAANILHACPQGTEVTTAAIRYCFEKSVKLLKVQSEPSLFPLVLQLHCQWMNLCLSREQQYDVITNLFAVSKLLPPISSSPELRWLVEETWNNGIYFFKLQQQEKAKLWFEMGCYFSSLLSSEDELRTTIEKQSVFVL